MFSWEWEDFEEIVKGHQVVVDDHGPLKSPIRNFSIKRDADLQLVMLTHAPVDAKDSAVSYPPGTVRQNTDKVTFVSKLGLQLVAEGVHAGTTRTIIEVDPPLEEVQQDCSIHRLTGSLHPSDRETKYIIDWLGNVASSFHWPDRIDELIETKKTWTFSLNPAEPVMTGSNRHEGGSWSCVRLTVDGHTLFLCSAKADVAKGTAKPGYIVYLGNPSDEFRDRMRRCLSFALGLYLVYLGCSCFCENWRLIRFEAVSAYSMGGRAFDLPPMPPSPLGLRWEWEVDREIFSRAINALYRKYDALNLATASWAYWHAVAATPHIAGVHFGAALESLERAYLDMEGSKVKRLLLESENWNALRLALENCIAQTDLSEDIATILKNKVGNLNLSPQSIVTENLLSNLGLVLGPREKKALLLRNISVHGKDDEVDAEWIRDLKILRIRFHRMLLAMTEANDSYYDYFTIGRPTRKLAEPIADVPDLREPSRPKSTA